MTGHDCIATGCTGPALRAHTSAVAQGFPAIAQPDGHPDPEGVLRAIRGTATILRSSVARSSESVPSGANHQVSVERGASTTGAATSPKKSARATATARVRTGRGTSVPSRSTPTKTTTPAGKAEVVEERADSPAQRAV